MARGGKFGHGFLSAGIIKGVTTAIHGGHVAVRLSASAIVGGTTSKISGGKFANGAKTASFQFLFNEYASYLRSRSEHQEYAVKARWARGRTTTTTSVNKETGAHMYKVRGHICSASSSGCNESYADEVFGHVNKNDVPFSGDGLTTGRRELQPIGFIAADPISHVEKISDRTSVNIALKGHQFYPGTVTHKVHFEGGNLYYDMTGVGTGSNPSWNNWIGLELFRPGVVNTVSQYGYRFRYDE